LTNTIYDSDRKVAEQGKLSRGDSKHQQNFLDAIRSGDRLNAEIVGGHKSTLFCHLGNIAYCTGLTLEIDPATGQIRNNSAAAKLWACDYRQGWMPNASP
jgi:hypothetical protein